MQVGRLFTRRRLKWAAVAATLAAAALMLFSSMTHFGRSWYEGDTHHEGRLLLARGGIYARRSLVLPDGRIPGTGWVARVDPGVQLVPSVTFSRGQYYVFIPWWPLVVVLLAPTVWLWRSDRPDRCPHCRCELGTLESAFCPKCGKPTGREV